MKTSVLEDQALELTSRRRESKWAKIEEVLRLSGLPLEGLTFEREMASVSEVDYEPVVSVRFDDRVLFKVVASRRVVAAVEFVRDCAVCGVSYRTTQALVGRNGTDNLSKVAIILEQPNLMEIEYHRCADDIEFTYLPEEGR